VRKTLSTYIHALFEVGRLRIAGAIALMLLFSLSEGIGVAGADADSADLRARFLRTNS
jgi:hypothetical protein